MVPEDSVGKLGVTMYLVADRATKVNIDVSHIFF